VLEVRREQTDRLGAEGVLGVVTAPGRRDVVRLVDDQQVELARERRLPLGRQHLPQEPQRALAFKEVDRGDEPREVCPRIHVEAAPPAQLLHQLTVDDAELEAELIPHLIVPLDLKARWTDD
jgi:hypothetical protein